jgi:hypothetical protein
VIELSERPLIGTMLTVQTTLGFFLLALFSIHLMPHAVATFGWSSAFVLLSAGPLVGVLAMYRLRSDPESLKLSGGRR